MKISLYSIEQEYLNIVNKLIENGGELDPETEQALAINKQNLETKGINYGFVIKEIDAQCDIIDKEIERLEALKKSRQKVADRLKINIKNAMELFEVEKIESPVLKISFRNSEAVEVLDLKLLDRKFIKVSQPTESADKNAIKDAIKAGETVQGATLKVNKNLQIK